MGKILPKKKFFKSSIYSPKLNVGSHIENVRNSLEDLIFSNERETEKLLLKKRIKLVVIVTIFLMIIGSVISPKGKAEVAIFYPSSCLGGWNNPRNAEGEPQVETNDNEKEFTKDNSAILSKTTNADIYCGGFVGKIEENTKPTKIIVSLSWSKGEDVAPMQEIKSDSFASSSGEILDSTSTDDISFTLSSSTEATSTEIVSTSSEEIKTQDSTTSTTTEQSSTTQTEQTKETSIIKQVIDVIENTIQKTFGGDENPKTENTPQEIVPTPAPATPAPDNNEPTSYIDNFFKKISTSFFVKVFAEETNATNTTSEEIINTIKQDAVTTTTSTPVSNDSTQEEKVIVKSTSIKASSTDIDASTTDKIDISSTTQTIENVASTTESTSTASLLDQALGVVLNSDTENESPNNFLEILYTFDGENWKSLGKVNESSMKYRTFEIPITATTSWSDMGQLQIKVKPIQRIDVAPTIYLDAIKIEVLYETPVAHEHPDFDRDILLKDKSDDGVRIVNIINSDTNANEIWYTTLDAQGEYGVAPGSWVEIKSDKVGSPYKLIDIYGQNIFLLDDAQKLLWVKNLQKETNDGFSIVGNGTTTAQFTKSNGEEWVFEYNYLTRASVARIKQ